MVHGAYVGLSDRFRLTCHFTGQASEGTSFRAVTMLRAQILVDNCPNSLACRSGVRRCEYPHRKTVLEHRTGCLRDQLVLAIEVCIETAMSQTQLSHQRSDSRALHPVTAELLSSLLQEAVMGLFFVLARVAHGYMIVIMHNLMHFVFPS